MSARYYCDNRNRLERVALHATLNGIDYLEVLDAEAPAGSPRQQTLLVHFAKALPGTFTARNVIVESRPRAAAVGVVWARRAADAAVLRAEGRISAGERDFLLALPDVERVLAVRTDGTGDFSMYTLRLVASATDASPPDPIDVRLAEVAFSFKVECPSDFDCAPDDECPPEILGAPIIDYLSKDYASFRRLMLDRLSVTLPGWQDRSGADVHVTLVELLAYVGDHLSYAQDAVATEAYLETARLRTSLRRHARLLDYAVHEGTNARAFLHLRVESGGPSDGAFLPAEASFATPGSTPVVFEPLDNVQLRARHNTIEFYTWSDDECCLAAGATQATLFSVESSSGTAPITVAVGDWLVFEETVSPTTGVAVDANPAHRHTVRLTSVTPTTDSLTGDVVVDIAWHDDDALPFALCVSARVPTGAGGFGVVPISVARGNVVLVDEGETVVDDALVPDRVTNGRYRPRLRDGGIAYSAPYDVSATPLPSAKASIEQDARRAMPSRLSLWDGGEAWTPRRDLLGSDRFAPEFVLETEHDGRAFVRFGDDVRGRAPSVGAALTATYRRGKGTAGNVGAGAIQRANGVPGIERVRNLLAARGATAPETAQEIKLYAPQAFRTQERAVTESDYARIAERLPGVQRATARFRWTGSWTTVFLTVDRVGGLPVRDDARFLKTLRAHLDRYRMAGYDLEINDPVFVPLDVSFSVCAAPGYFKSDVKEALLRAFSTGSFADGRRGFFHPDAFTFGQPVYLSQLFAAALGVEGVASVEAVAFQRYGRRAAGELQAGVVQPSDLEVLRLDNNPSAPEDGKLTFQIAGGV